MRARPRGKKANRRRAVETNRRRNHQAETNMCGICGHQSTSSVAYSSTHIPISSTTWKCSMQQQQQQQQHLLSIEYGLYALCMYVHFGLSAKVLKARPSQALARILSSLMGGRN